jgi:hypothetical protein
MKQGDVQNIYHLQMPRWLFTDTKYMELALETKVAYTFLLNRFQLSRLNGWVNEDGAVFIIYTRRSLAEEMQVSYRKIIEAMKELTAAGLIWEKRCGRGDANQIYLALIEHAGALLRRLRYMGLLARSGDGCICLPDLLRDRPDSEILLSLDVLLALRPERLLQVSARQPYKLCFLLQRSDGWIDYFAVMPVQPGHEGRISQLLQAEQKNYVFLLPLENMEQHRQITLSRSHFFVLRQGERLRFYKGGEAGK